MTTCMLPTFQTGKLVSFALLLGVSITHTDALVLRTLTHSFSFEWYSCTKKFLDL